MSWKLLSSAPYEKKEWNCKSAETLEKQCAHVSWGVSPHAGEGTRESAHTQETMHCACAEKIWHCLWQCSLHDSHFRLPACIQFETQR